MDTTPLHDAHVAFLEAATKVADAGGARVTEPGQWNAEQILAHVALVDAATLAAAASVAAGVNTTFDNRVLLDTWTIERTRNNAGGSIGLQQRIRQLGVSLCTLGAVLGDAELDTVVPSLLLSNDQLLLNEPVSVRALIDGLADEELPGHTTQLLDLLTRPLRE
jgi:hypothetical protein